MKAITRFWHNGSPVIVEGKIENGMFVVTSVDYKHTPTIVFDNYQSVKGSTQFEGCQFRSDVEFNGEYFATYYIIPEENIESTPIKNVSDVILGVSAEIRNRMPKEKSDDENDLLFGENNW